MEVFDYPLSPDQISILTAVRDHTKVSVKSGHSTGKTDVVGKILIPLFLHAHDPCVIVTTAPTRQQIRQETWRYLRQGVKRAKIPMLPGLKPVEPEWRVNEDRYAIGISTDSGVAFRGKHDPNMLVVIDEANGVPAWAWEEIENWCTAHNNRRLALANPIAPTGEFFDTFNPKHGWYNITLSCLNHPNVLSRRPVFPGAVTWEWVDEQIRKHCQPVDRRDKQAGDIEWPRGSGQFWRPNPRIQARVLGEFPDEGPDTLIPLSWIHSARNRTIDVEPTMPIDLGFDVAYSGGDHCVIFARKGPCVLKRRKWQGTDPDKAAFEIAGIVKDYNNRNERVGTIAVDGIGIGAGIAPALNRMKGEGKIKFDRAVSVIASERAFDAEQFANRRSEMMFGLAERFRTGQIDMSRLGSNADDFETQAPQIDKQRDSRLKHLIESKDKIRDKLKESPDDVDALMLAFLETIDNFAANYAEVMCA